MKYIKLEGTNIHINDIYMYSSVNPSSDGYDCFICGLTANLGECSSLKVELWGILHGLKLVQGARILQDKSVFELQSDD